MNVTIKLPFIGPFICVSPLLLSLHSIPKLQARIYSSMVSMAHSLPLVATPSHPRKSISMLKLPPWAKLFPLPNRKEPPIVFQSDNYKFTIERGVTRVDINIISTINVEHMKTRLLMGKMFEIPKKGKVITGNSLYLGRKVLKTLSLWPISVAIGLRWSLLTKMKWIMFFTWKGEWKTSRNKIL